MNGVPRGGPRKPLVACTCPRLAACQSLTALWSPVEVAAKPGGQVGLLLHSAVTMQVAVATQRFGPARSILSERASG